MMILLRTHLALNEDIMMSYADHIPCSCWLLDDDCVSKLNRLEELEGKIMLES